MPAKDKAKTTLESWDVGARVHSIVASEISMTNRSMTAAQRRLYVGMLIRFDLEAIRLCPPKEDWQHQNLAVHYDYLASVAEEIGSKRMAARFKANAKRELKIAGSMEKSTSTNLLRGVGDAISA